MKKGNYVAFLPFYLMIVILFIGFAHSGSNAVTVLHESRPLEWTHCIVTFILNRVSLNRNLSTIFLEVFRKTLRP